MFATRVDKSCVEQRREICLENMNTLNLNRDSCIPDKRSPMPFSIYRPCVQSFMCFRDDRLSNEKKSIL